jgi:hypothetical protein
MDEGGNVQYLLLHSIKEILLEAGSNSTDITSLSKAIWERLTVASQAEDNKAVGAECIGRLAIIDPKTYMPKLQVCILLSDKHNWALLTLTRLICVILPQLFVLWVSKPSATPCRTAMRLSMVFSKHH